MRPISRVLARFTVAALLALPAVLSAQAAAQKHMLFRVRGPAGAEAYILGSVHLLTPDAGKLPAEVDSAFAHAGTIAFETHLDSVQARGLELLARGQYKDGATLRTSLSPDGAVKADSVLRLYGASLDQFNTLKPWLVSLLLTQRVMQLGGFQAQYGVETQLSARAKQAAKPIVALEPVEVQLGIFDRIPPADQEKMLTTASGPDSSMLTLKAVKDAWLTGNTLALDSLLNHAAKDSPTMFTIMVVERNQSWIPKIEQLAAAKNNALIVVGAAHLVGKQGVLALLQAKGYTIDQM